MKKTPVPAWRKALKRLHFPIDVILLCVRWYLAYSLSLRNLEEMMAERGVAVDHATVHRWVRFCRSKPPVEWTGVEHNVWATVMNPEVAKVLKRLHYPLEVMLTCVRWYVAYP